MHGSIRNESRRDHVAPIMGKKRALIASALAAVVVLTTFGVGSAQEGGLRNFTESALRLVSNALNPSQEEVVEAEQEVEETTDITVKPDPAPITYPNGFTEGDVLESSGVPTYSAPEFVPTGPDAPKEGEIDPCITSDDYDACIQKSFDDYWEGQKPEGEGWEEIRIGEAPVMWYNQDLNTLVSHSKFGEYMEANMHEFVTGAQPDVTLSSYRDPDGYLRMSLTWYALMQLSDYDYYHPMNQAFAWEASFRAVLVMESGERLNLHNPYNEEFVPNEMYLSEVPTSNWVFNWQLPWLEPCTSGMIESSILVTDGREFPLSSVSLRVPPPIGLSCDEPSLESVSYAIGWVYEQDADGNLILESAHLNYGGANIFGVASSEFEGSFLSFKAPSNFSFSFSVTEVERTSNGVFLKFGEQGDRLRGDYPYGTYQVHLWLVDTQGPVKTFSLPDIQITDSYNRANYDFSVHGVP